MISNTKGIATDLGSGWELNFPALTTILSAHLNKDAAFSTLHLNGCPKQAKCIVLVT